MIEVPLIEIADDGALQARVGVHFPLVAEYAERMRLYGGWGTFPAVQLFRLPDGRLVVGDGMHRRFAAAEIGLVSIPAVVSDGTPGDALRWSIEHNNKGKLAFTNADKRSAVVKALALPELAILSDRALAELVGVSHDFVNRLRVSSDDTSATPRAAEQKTERPRPTQTPARVESAKKSNAKAREASVKKAKLTRPQRVYAAAIKALTKLGDDAEALRAVREQFNAYVDARLAELE